MSATVLSFWRPRPASRDWSQQELAEFYRVAGALMQAGLRVETDRGISDEGEPWFVFCRADDGEVVIHFARIADEYVVAGVLQDGVARGRDFPGLVAGLIAKHPAVRPEAAPKSNIIMHPAAMLVALVAAALLKTGEAKAHTGDDSGPRERGAAAPSLVGKSNGAGSQFAVQFEPAHAAAIIAAATLALASSTEQDGEMASAPRPTQQTAATSTFDPDHFVSVQARGTDAGAYGLDDSSALGQLPLDTLPAPTGTAEVQHPLLQAVAADAAKLLSLVAVLWTLPETAEGERSADLTPARAAEMLGFKPPADARPLRGAAAVAPAAQPVASESGSVDAGTNHDSGANLSKAVLVLDMAKSSGTLPDVLSVKVAFAHEGSASPAVAVVTHTDRLPEVLAKLLLPDSTHTAVTEHMPPPQPSATPHPVTVAEAPEVAPAPSAAVAPPPDTRPTATTVQKAIDLFKQATPNYQVIVSGVDVFIIDPDALYKRGGEVHTEKWSFVDGSSISLVGLGLEPFHHVGLV